MKINLILFSPIMLLINSCSSEQFLPKLENLEINSIPKNSLGSNYSDLMIEIYKTAKKSEYETNEEYKSKIVNIEKMIEQKYGKYFIFQLPFTVNEKMKYLPESKTLFYLPERSTSVSSSVLAYSEMIGYEDKDETTYMYGVNIQKCRFGLTFSLNSDEAKKIKENIDFRYFISGEIKLLKYKNNKINMNAFRNINESVPGLSSREYENQKGKNSISLYVDFMPYEFLIVQSSTGEIVARNKCDEY